MRFFQFIFAGLLACASTFAHADTTTTININAQEKGINVAPLLFGVFFEEINHAGQGGLYAELISNSNFGSEDYAPWYVQNSTNARLSLDSTYPLNYNNAKSLKVESDSKNAGQDIIVANPGYFGMNIEKGVTYDASFFILSHAATSVSVKLASTDGSVIYASTTLSIPSSSSWQRFSASLLSSTSDVHTVFQFHFHHLSTSVYLDAVSLFPSAASSWHGLNIRSDLGNMIADLKPAFVRFPGGCYVEGDRLGDRFNWKNALGPREERPGHYDLWNYWSEDGLGMYEYLMFIEQLSTATGNRVEPIWVVNNGISHTQSIPVADIQAWIDDAFDSIEFAMGDVSTKYGAIRAEMGHPEIFQINYLAIGNEDCGKPWYNENYLAFYNAFQAKYPHMHLIANCDMTSNKLPTQLWDYHRYASSSWFFDNDRYWDSVNRTTTPLVFNSEYAVTDDAGRGNLRAGIAEAAWMIGLERNSDLVVLASYAPLLVNDHDQTWNPDAIVFNEGAAFGTPSYWVQYMFMNALNNTVSGSQYVLPSKSDTSFVTVIGTIASLKGGQNILIVKIVNKDVNTTSNVQVQLDNITGTLSSSAEVRTLTGSSATGVNTFDEPNSMRAVDSEITVDVASSKFQVTVAPLSLTIVRIVVA